MSVRRVHLVRGVVNRLLDLMFYLLIGVLMAMLFVELGNIIGRPWGMPIQGSVELTSYLGAIFVAISLFYTTLRHSNVVVELLTSKLRGGLRAVFEAIACLISIASVLLLAWAAGSTARKMSLEGERSIMLNLNLSVIRYVFMVGLLLVAVALAVDLWKVLTKGKK
jgi:TRAP-type C4-dicarboxylate transport system permease small subunit